MTQGRVASFLHVRLQQRRLDITRADGIDPDAVGAVRVPVALGQTQDAVFCSGVGGVVVVCACADETIEGGDVNDTAAACSWTEISVALSAMFDQAPCDKTVLLLKHNGNLLPLAPSDSIQVDTDDMVPFLLVHLMRPLPTAADSGVVERDIQPPKSLDRFRDAVLDIFPTQHIHLHVEDLDTGVLLLESCAGGDEGFVVNIHEGQLGDAMLSEGICGRLPDAYVC